MDTFYAIYYDLIRYGHIFSGILWIGVLYFYNFIQAIALPRMAPEGRPHYQTSILPFSLNVFPLGGALDAGLRPSVHHRQRD